MRWLAGELVVILDALRQGLREGGRLLLERVQRLVEVVRREPADDGAEVDVLLVRSRDGQHLSDPVPERRDAQGVDALRHALDGLDPLSDGPEGRDTQWLPEKIDRDAEAVMVLGFLVEVGLRLLQLFGQRLILLRENCKKERVTVRDRLRRPKRK